MVCLGLVSNVYHLTLINYFGTRTTILICALALRLLTICHHCANIGFKTKKQPKYIGRSNLLVVEMVTNNLYQPTIALQSLRNICIQSLCSQCFCSKICLLQAMNSNGRGIQEKRSLINQNYHNITGDIACIYLLRICFLRSVLS